VVFKLVVVLVVDAVVAVAAAVAVVISASTTTIRGDEIGEKTPPITAATMNMFLKTGFFIIQVIIIMM
jgi:hypothetical protein